MKTHLLGSNTTIRNSSWPVFRCLALGLGLGLAVLFGNAARAEAQERDLSSTAAPVANPELHFSAAGQSSGSQESIDSQPEPDSKAAMDAQPIEQTAERKFTRGHVVQLLIIATMILWGYSLVMSGKHGLGWLLLASIGGVVAWFGKMIRSVFQEVTTGNEVGDWEDE